MPTFQLQELSDGCKDSENSMDYQPLNHGESGGQKDFIRMKIKSLEWHGKWKVLLLLQLKVLATKFQEIKDYKLILL